MYYSSTLVSSLKISEIRTCVYKLDEAVGKAISVYFDLYIWARLDAVCSISRAQLNFIKSK